MDISWKYLIYMLGVIHLCLCVYMCFVWQRLFWHCLMIFIITLPDCWHTMYVDDSVVSLTNAALLIPCSYWCMFDIYYWTLRMTSVSGLSVTCPLPILVILVKEFNTNNKLIFFAIIIFIMIYCHNFDFKFL